MCGRITQAKELAALLKAFQAELAEIIEVPLRYNLPPTEKAVVVQSSENGKTYARLMQWGLVPPWSKGEKYQPIVNIRAETALNRPAFNTLLQRSRCIIPADGFYEWKEVPTATKKMRKVPYRYVLKSEGIFAMGGIYQTLRRPNGQELMTFCLITTEPNELVAQVCDRMPVLIPPDKIETWLNPKAPQIDYVQCLGPYPSNSMLAYEVSSIVNSGKNDSPECINPVPVQRGCHS